MIDLSDQPYVVTFKDGNVAADGGDVLLLGVSGPDDSHGLILAARELLWVPLSDLIVETSLSEYVRIGEQDEAEVAQPSD